MRIYLQIQTQSRDFELEVWLDNEHSSPIPREVPPPSCLPKVIRPPQTALSTVDLLIKYLKWGTFLLKSPKNFSLTPWLKIQVGWQLGYSTWKLPKYNDVAKTEGLLPSNLSTFVLFIVWDVRKPNSLALISTPHVLKVLRYIKYTRDSLLCFK